MINKKFESYKVKREIKKSGREFVFSRSTRNAFGEPTSEFIVVGAIRGLWHVSLNYVALTINETTQVRNSSSARSNQAILCLFEDAKALNLAVNDIVAVSGTLFKVVALRNLQEWDILSEIDVERVDDGKVQV